MVPIPSIKAERAGSDAARPLDMSFREGDGDLRAAVQLRADVHLCVVELGDVLHDREAEAGAADGTAVRLIDTEEAGSLTPKNSRRRSTPYFFVNF